MFGISGFFGLLSTEVWPEMTFFPLRSLISSMAEMLRSSGDGSGGGSGGGGGGGAAGTPAGRGADATGLTPAVTTLCISIHCKHLTSTSINYRFKSKP